MAQRKDPWPDGVTRTRLPPGLLVEQPRGHAELRYDTLRKLLCGLFVMRREGMVPAGLVTLRGAGNQFEEGHGTRPADTQGAHKLPRQLLVGGQPIEHWLRAAGADEIALLSMLGAEATATVLPAAWNRADSLWEIKGLAEAFRAAAAEVMGWPSDAVAALALFPGFWVRFHQAAGQALAAAIAHCAPGDARLGPLLTYQLVHQTVGAAWEREPGSVRAMLGASFR